MRIFSTPWGLIWVAFAVLAMASGPGHARQADPREQLARAYLDHLYAFEFEAMAALLDEGAIFEDSSVAVIAGAPVKVEGRAAIVEVFALGADQITQASYEVDKLFTNGEQVVFSLTYNATMKGAALGLDIESVEIRIPAVTVLTLKDEKVVSHIDYVDYESFLNQANKAQEN